MMALSLILVALLGVSVVSGSETLSPPTEEKLFADWMGAFDKSYENNEEASVRMQIFMENNGKSLLHVLSLVNMTESGSNKVLCLNCAFLNLTFPAPRSQPLLKSTIVTRLKRTVWATISFRT